MLNAAKCLYVPFNLSDEAVEMLHCIQHDEREIRT
jgi:hypothetical protein